MTDKERLVALALLFRVGAVVKARRGEVEALAAEVTAVRNPAALVATTFASAARAP